MTTKTPKKGYMLAALMALAMDAPMVWADAPPQLQRPLLENYSDYNQFLIDMAAYKQHLREQQQAPQEQAQPADQAHAAEPAASPEEAASPPPVPAAGNTAVESDDENSPPPLIINGPEDLDSAVEAAKSFPHPSYRSTRRYNRSTAQSFRLPPLDPEDLEGSAVPGMWLGDNSLPDDIMSMDASALDEQSSVDAGLKDVYRSIFAAQKADDSANQNALEETLVKDLGSTPHIDIIPQAAIPYPASSDNVGSITGLVRESGTTVITFHGETN